MWALLEMALKLLLEQKTKRTQWWSLMVLNLTNSWPKSLIKFYLRFNAHDFSDEILELKIIYLALKPRLLMNTGWPTPLKRTKARKSPGPDNICSHLHRTVSRRFFPSK